jgi:hypothetical protein
MKKILSIALSIIILASTSGFTVVKHYCPMNKKTSYSLSTIADCCGKKGDAGSGCCKNTKIELQKVKDVYTPAPLHKISASEQYVHLAISSHVYSIFSLESIFICGPLHDCYFPPGKALSFIVLHRTLLI